MLVGILRDGRTAIPNNISHRIARRPGRRLRVNTRSLPIRRSQRQGHLRLGLVICSPRSLSEDKMQLAVDQFTCRIKVTGVGCGLRHDVEHDLAEAVEPPEAEEIGPPRWCCMKRASGDDPIGTLGVGPVPLKHFLDGLSVTYVPSIVGRAKNVFDCDLVPSYDRLEPEALNVERKVVYQADAAPARRKNRPPGDRRLEYPGRPQECARAAGSVRPRAPALLLMAPTARVALLPISHNDFTNPSFGTSSAMRFASARAPIGEWNRINSPQLGIVEGMKFRDDSPPRSKHDDDDS